MRRFSLVLVTLLACGGGSGAGSDARDVKKDSGDHGSPPAEVTEAEEAVEAGETEEAVETEEELPAADIPPEPGEPGYACTENTQCNSGVCLDTPEGKVCARVCVESCPSGYTCRNLTIGSDIVPVCTPLFLMLCDPCSQNKDCNSDATGGAAVCVDRGPAGRFCGGDCSTSACPDGYACEEVPDPQGLKSRQCIPAGGAECACSARAIKAGLSTECYQQTADGTCKGVRKCILSGLTDCDAATPRKETCNGLDDDCNGLTDENLGTEIECEKHAVWDGSDHICKGKGECVNGAIVNCDARTPVPEVCNGIDDDCNGLEDDALCDDGNDCTLDKCNVGDGTCAHDVKEGKACDDGNPCSLNDHCDATGLCIGGGQKNCDDGNPCTDDYCNTGNGECAHSNNTAPCEDKTPAGQPNKCTVGDHCENGSCISGTLKACDEVDACRVSTGCKPETGACEWAPANEGGACDDGKACTVQDKCSNGQCAGVDEYCKAICAQQGKLCFSGCYELFGFPTCPCLCL